MSIIMKMLSGSRDDEEDYRGFSTSISHAYVDASPSVRSTDACALACCGILQSDRDRYLLTGVPPPSWSRRIYVHFFAPIALLMIACYGAVHISDRYWNDLISTILVALILVLIVMQLCFKGRWKRVMVRKELLWRKYQMIASSREASTNTMYPPEEDDEEFEHAQLYLQGQSRCDLHCAHAMIGCYRTDLSKENNDKKQPTDFCGWLFQQLCVKTCCCGCHLQVCGICALAQEARELNRLVPLTRRRIDYVTMEPTMRYYAEILRQRSVAAACKANRDWWISWSSLSRLSKQLIQLWIIVVVLLLLFGILLHFSFLHVFIFIGTFLHAWFLLWLLHGYYHNSKEISWDLTIKAFSCGFFVVTILVITWELGLGMAFNIVMTLVLKLFGVSAANGNGFNWIAGFAQAASRRGDDYLSVFGQDHPLLYALIVAFEALVLAASVEELAKYLGYPMIMDHPDFWTRFELESSVNASIQKLRQRPLDDGEDHNEDNYEDEKGEIKALKDLDTSQQDKTLKIRGAMISMAMVSIALGFSCCENLLYVFIYNENSLRREFMVLIFRMLFPIHPICAAIQSIGVVRRDIQNDSRFELGQILFPAVLLHGTFDWIVMFVGEFCNFPSVAVVLAFLFVLAALAFYYKLSQEQRQQLEDKDKQNSSTFL